VIGYIVGVFLIPVFFIGCVVLAVLVICSLVFNIMGAIQASKGIAYRFPFNIRIIK
jgi:uncharacterized Tic20 family protein